MHIDFETFSEIDLTKVGAYRYAEERSTEALILCSAGERGDPAVFLPHRHGTQCPPKLKEAARDPDVLFYAHHAEFERQVWRSLFVARWGWPDIPLHRWRCTAVLAAAANMPRSLEDACIAAGVREQKDPRGKKLIPLFCKPRKPTKADSRTRILPTDKPKEFQAFIEYCQQDVRAERELHLTLPALQDWEWDNYHFTCRMNDNGVPIDMPLVRNAHRVVKAITRKLNKQTEEITGGIRPTQREKIMVWLEQHGAPMPNMQAETVRKMLNGNVHVPKLTRQVLEMRNDANMAATKKLVSMQVVAGDDWRARGTHLHYGAHHARITGRLIQPQNFKRGWEDARRIANALRALRTGNAELFEILYDKPLETISNVIRGFIAPRKGHTLLVIDYSQIEARVADWYANHTEGLKEWASGIDKYKLMATRIFQCEMEDVTPEMRRLAKNAVLGCTFGMSDSAFLIYCHNVGATDVTEELAELAVGTYRDVNEPVVELWDNIDNYAKEAIESKGKILKLRHIKFYMEDHWLVMEKPSGNRILYPHARLEMTKSKRGKKRESIVFDGMHGRTHTHGSKLTENIVSSTARDEMYHGMRKAEKDGGFFPVISVHDEGGFEEPDTKDVEERLAELKGLMCDIPHWLKGCPLTVKGFITPFYRKD